MCDINCKNIQTFYIKKVKNHGSLESYMDVFISGTNESKVQEIESSLQSLIQKLTSVEDNLLKLEDDLRNQGKKDKCAS